MTKYNVGDVLEITEDFELEGASYEQGQKYTVAEIFDNFYVLDYDEYSLTFSNTIAKVDAHSGFRKVEPKVEFKTGDKIRLLEGAHSSQGYSTDTPEKLKAHLDHWGLDYQTVFWVDQKLDSDGDVHVHVAHEFGAGLYVLPEFLVPWVEAQKPAEHMELGGTYWNPEVGAYYTVTYIDFEAERVHFVFNGGRPSERRFESIPRHFDGVLPPVNPAAQEEPKFKVGQVWRNTQDRVLSITAVDDSLITYVYTDDGTPSIRRVELTDGWTLGTQEVGEVNPDSYLASTVLRSKKVFERSKSKVESQPETISVDALREAYEYVDQEYFDIDKLIQLAKRLS